MSCTDGALGDALTEGALLAMQAADKAVGSGKAYYLRVAKTLRDHEAEVRAANRPSFQEVHACGPEDLSGFDA